ncbi:glycoside hydrolase domain-containing protein [Neobacillus drentensis]|uniref:glycoside hydrolase domain-containing protein n=1 Tax=Neobacillus drentensis TaxID=220684 RepID=UPI002FFEEB20
MDLMVLQAQEWLNGTYGGRVGYNAIQTNGKTGWATMYALTRALQIELGIAIPADNFGSGTLSALQSKYGNITEGFSANPNIVKIIQSGLFCKGYNPTAINGTFGPSTFAAVKAMHSDIVGVGYGDGVVTPKLFKALLTMDAYIVVNNGSYEIRQVQQWLNRKYNNRLNFFYSPCDGHFSRNIQKNLVYAIQYEIEMTDSVANGNFGPGTQQGIKDKAVLTVGSVDSTKNFVKLFQAAMIFNGYSVAFDGVFSSALSDEVKEFQEFVALPLTGKGDFPTWASLLVSTGDPTRKGTACDCSTTVTPERAQSLYNAGYRVVGRYLTNAGNSTFNKKIQPGELDVIKYAGLNVFPIYQTYGSFATYFNKYSARVDLERAVTAAEKLGFRRGNVIYFAVDFDAMDTDIVDFILPYFESLAMGMVEYHDSKYKIGVYGARNVCIRVSEKGYSQSSFVSGMSTGFSGNLGFPLPQDWAFDQISTINIGEGSGFIQIDNNINSGRNTGSNVFDSLVQTLSAARIEEISKDIIEKVKTNAGRSAYNAYAKLNCVDKLLIQQMILEIYEENRGEMPDKTTHYNRNLPNTVPDSIGNTNLPPTPLDAIRSNWIELGDTPEEVTKKARYHQNNLKGNGPNLKFIEPDLEEGKTEINPDGTSYREVVYYANGTINSTPEDMGTYNIGKARKGINNLSHNMEDVFPYILLGNATNDSTTLFDRLALLD